MITFNVEKIWFDKIKSGEKTHEYREVKDYWTDRFVKNFFGVSKKTDSIIFDVYKEGMESEMYDKNGYRRGAYLCFMNGMFPEDKRVRLYARMESIRIIDGKNTDLGINKLVYDIKFELIPEKEKEELCKFLESYINKKYKIL